MNIRFTVHDNCPYIDLKDLCTILDTPLNTAKGLLFDLECGNHIRDSKGVLLSGCLANKLLDAISESYLNRDKLEYVRDWMNNCFIDIFEDIEAEMDDDDDDEPEDDHLKDIVDVSQKVDECLDRLAELVKQYVKNC